MLSADTSKFAQNPLVAALPRCHTLVGTSMKIEYGITGSRSENPSFSNRSRHHWWIILFAFVTVIGVVISGILPRIQARATLRKETADLAVPTVSVVLPKQSAPAQEIVLPANVQAFADAPIYARTNGYLKRWYA